MKLFVSRKALEAGNVLATTLVITFIIGITLASFLLLTRHQTFANLRSQSWNHTMAVSESGIEDALQMINKYSSDSEKLLLWAADARQGKDGWTHLSNHLYKCSRFIGDPVTARYDVFVDNTHPTKPKLRAEGWTVYNYEFDHSGGVAVAGASAAPFKSTELHRTVLVETRRDALWTVAMLADHWIDLKGTKIATDSFNSADPSASDWSWHPNATHGLYDPSRRLDNGDVACNSDIFNSLNVGNANIMGHVSTGPGGQVQIGATGSVGSEAWVAGGNYGIQSGHSSDDMNVKMIDIGLPSTTWLPLPYAGGEGFVTNGMTYRHVIAMSGDYTASTLQGGVYVKPGVNARIHLTQNVALGPGDELYIDPQAQRLTIYMEGQRFKFGGGLSNETGNAAGFLYFGLPSNTELLMGGNSSFIGAIYANHADLVLGGGGKDTYDFIGATVSSTVKMNGHFNFHYDENLVNIGPSRGFIPTRWAEL